MVSVGETSGTVPETLHRLSPQFEEEARRSMTTLTNMLNVLIRVMVGGFIIFLIFSLALKYIGTINSFTDSPLGNPGE
jgi:type IV pilus assembly protein PilC